MVQTEIYSHKNVLVSWTLGQEPPQISMDDVVWLHLDTELVCSSCYSIAQEMQFSSLL